MKIDSGEDFLALLNRLLEGLHQAGMTNFGSHLSIVYVASGAQHVDTVQNQYVGPHPSPLQRRGRRRVVYSPRPAGCKACKGTLYP